MVTLTVFKGIGANLNLRPPIYGLNYKTYNTKYLRNNGLCLIGRAHDNTELTQITNYTNTAVLQKNQ